MRGTTGSCSRTCQVKLVEGNFCRATKSNAKALRFATIRLVGVGCSVASLSIRRKGSLCPAPTRGTMAAIIVRILVDAVMSLNATAHWVFQYHLSLSSMTQYRGVGRRSGSAFSSTGIRVCCPGRNKFSAFIVISAARWSNACTILPSYSGIHSPFGLPKRLSLMGNALSCSSSSSFVRNRSESFAM